MFGNDKAKPDTLFETTHLKQSSLLHQRRDDLLQFAGGGCRTQLTAQEKA